MKELSPFQRDRNWFVIFSVALIFGIVWTMLGEGADKLIFTVVAFALFIHSGVTMETRAHHAEHDAEGHG